MTERLRFRSSTTRMDPLEAHLAHIRHLVKRPSLRAMLKRHHGLSTLDSNRRSESIAPFLEQAIALHDGSRAVSSRVRPILQYYSYMNLAVACVLLYRPPNWEQFNRHGAELRIPQDGNLGLSSKVVKVQKAGAIQLLNAVLTGTTLRTTRYALRDLLIPVAMISSELEAEYKIEPMRLVVLPIVADLNEGANVCARIQMNLRDKHGNQLEKVFPRRRLLKACPALDSHFNCDYGVGGSRMFTSTQSWTKANARKAQEWLENHAFYVVNYGGQEHLGGSSSFCWRLMEKGPLLATITAALLLSFVSCSLARYRPNVLNKVQNSRLNLMFDVFACESDGVFIPTFRNLLYGESLLVTRAELT